VVIAFDDLRLDLTLFELRRAGVVVPLEPQAFDVLVHLIRHRDRVVSKEELMDAVWGGRFVTESAVTSRIKQVRRAVGDDGQEQRVIRTVHGRGYRFARPVVEVPAEPVVAVPAEPVVAVPAEPVVAVPVQRAEPAAPASSGMLGRDAPVRYTVSDGLQIAYQVTGRPPGPGVRDIVLVAGFVSHLEQDWGEPQHDHFLNRLGMMGRLVRFDKRGTGMSDRPPGLPDLETRMHDVLAVMDELDIERAALFGYSEGGPMCTLFAAAHPERVSALVLYGSYARRSRTSDYPWADTIEQRTAFTEQLVRTWDWEADMLFRCPSATPQMQRWWGRRARAAATPTTVRSLMEMNNLVDVRDALPAVRVPTLVVHRTGDLVCQVEGGRFLAARIPGAQLVELPGDDHFVSGDPDQLLDPIEDFLARTPEPGAPELALAAIVAVDGPDAAAFAERLAAGTALLRRTAEGAPVALFDGPATAIRAAERHLRRDAERRRLRPADVPSPSLGLHIAEVARNGPTVSGFGVATAVALAELAGPGQLRASATVRDLLAGSGVTLVEDGAHRVGPAGRQPVYRTE
jgi:pimeloyl-ACP methyl ester carboxylesterase/DNA-binding winged helix-turn-helix (wHTH) protein